VQQKATSLKKADVAYVSPFALQTRTWESEVGKRRDFNGDHAEHILDTRQRYLDSFHNSA
jgi:hypothetical protein